MVWKKGVSCAGIIPQAYQRSCVLTVFRISSVNNENDTFYHFDVSWRHCMDKHCCKAKSYKSNNFFRRNNVNQAWTGIEPMTSAMPVQCSTSWATKLTRSWSNCEFVIYPWRMNKWIWIYENIYLNCGWKIKQKKDPRSYSRNLSSCEMKAWKTFRLKRESNAWPLRCSALPTELSSQLGVGHIVNS